MATPASGKFKGSGSRKVNALRYLCLYQRRGIAVATVLFLVLLSLALHVGLVAHLASVDDALGCSAQQLQNPQRLRLPCPPDDDDAAAAPSPRTPPRRNDSRLRMRCYRPPDPVILPDEHHPLPPPTALVITLIHAESRENADSQLGLFCQLAPTQQRHFLGPHGMDRLVLLSGSGVVAEKRGQERIVDCLNLSPASGAGVNSSRTWTNLDGSVLVAAEYEYGAPSRSRRGRILLGEQASIRLPGYVRSDPSVLSEPFVPPSCADTAEYIQGTRFYTNEMLHLSVLAEYDYWIKMDVDIVFGRAVEWNVLHDMRVRGAVFAHTGEYEGGDFICSRGIRGAVEAYVAEMGASSAGGGGESKSKPSWARRLGWTVPCSVGVPDFEVDADLYYTNLVIGETRFWTSEPVLDFAQFLTEYRPGFFKFRWTDQIFFHKALGLFAGPDFQDSVADYTELRCAPLKECWESVWGGHTDDCSNGGYFMHQKGWPLAMNPHDAEPRGLVDLERPNGPRRTKYVRGMCRGRGGLFEKLQAASASGASAGGEPNFTSIAESLRRENPHLPRCGGLWTAADRRRLAAKGKRGAATAEEWRNLASCMMRRRAGLGGHLYVHASKAGGTSLRGMMEREGGGCNDTAKLEFEAINPFVGWVREDEIHGEGGFRFFEQDWITVRYPDSPTCAELAGYNRRHDNSLVVLERYLPAEGPCSDFFLTSMTVREPAERLLSHYNHLSGWCRDSDPDSRRCSDMFLPSQAGNKLAFNISVMAKTFDLVTDNYYSRVLGGIDAYQATFGDIGAEGRLRNRALQVLSEMDWIMIIGREDREKWEQNNRMIVNEALGFKGSLDHLNSAKGGCMFCDENQRDGALTPRDEEWLRELNRPDYELWAEAKRLHDLDVVSIRKLKEFASDIIHADASSHTNCCGDVCG